MPCVCYGIVPLLASLMLTAATARDAGKNTMPTAQLPFEPFTSEQEVTEANPRSGGTAKVPLSTLKAPMPPAYLPALGDMGLYAQLEVKPRGLAGSLRAEEYPWPWFGVQQSLRYRDNLDGVMLFANGTSLNLGIELHAWRREILSPYVNFELGGERFQKDESSDPFDLFRVSIASGIQLRLNRYVALSGQWMSVYYPDLRETIFVADIEPKQRFEQIEIAVNLMWETIR